jgi:hypothetical protein
VRDKKQPAQEGYPEDRLTLPRLDWHSVTVPICPVRALPYYGPEKHKQKSYSGFFVWRRDFAHSISAGAF